MRLTKAAVLMTLLIPFVASRALAGGEASGAHAIVEAGASQSTVPGVWELFPTYSVSVLRLDGAGQGFGGRVTLLPSPELAGVRELSADAMARFANDGPLYLKVIAGAAWLPANGLWPPRVRSGAEVGLTAIRSAFGLEAGIAAVYTFPPSRPGDGEWVISAGMGILWGFGAPSRAPALTHLETPVTERPAGNPDRFAGPHGAVLTSGLGGEGGRPSVAAWSETQPLRIEEQGVIYQILLLRKPGDVMAWWSAEDVDRWTQPLSALEEKYIEAMSSPTVPEPIRMWPKVTPDSLTADQVEEMEHLWGRLPDPQGYSNWKNRHRILKHYFVTHPATVRLLMQLYEVSRDANLLAFSLERGWQMASGKEMFTDQDVSRLGAAAEFFTMMATTVAGGKLMKAARPVVERGVQPPLEPTASGSVGEVRSPGEPGQVIPLDRARTPRTPSSPAARPLPSADEEPLSATGTDGSPSTRRQSATGNEPAVASLKRPSQEPRGGANERAGGGGREKFPGAGDADYDGPLPQRSWTTVPDGQGAHLVERGPAKASPRLRKFDQPDTPRFYPNGSPQNAGQAHLRLHDATREVGRIDLKKPLGGFTTEEDLLAAYRRAYADPRLNGIRGDLRTPDGRTVLATDVTPAEALAKLLEWAKAVP